LRQGLTRTAVVQTRQALHSRGLCGVNWTGKEFFMSKMVSKFALAAGVVLAMALTFSCFNTQTADNEKRMLGTWIEVNRSNDSTTWIFNSNGTGKISGDNFKYGIVSDKMAIIINEPSYYPYIGTVVSDIYISNDGRTAIIKSTIWSDKSYNNGHLLRKKN
jgi:hypothetical protein